MWGDSQQRKLIKPLGHADNITKASPGRGPIRWDHPCQSNGDARLIPLPGYVDKDAWDGFVEMRKRIKAPLTVRAATLILFELQRIKDAGHSPNAALDQSTMKCWRDVWPLKDKDLQRAATAGTGELQKYQAEPRRGPTAEEAERLRDLRQRLRSVR